MSDTALVPPALQPGLDPALGAEAYRLDRAHVFHSWSAQADLDPLVIAGGAGCTLWDYTGRRYLDLSSQLVNTNIGHQHPAVVAAIKAQADELTTINPATANLARGRAAEAVLRHVDGPFSKVFFTNGGADAVENAIRLARLHTGRAKVISRYRSYHGNTGAAINATGDWRRQHNEYATGHIHTFGPYLYRSEFWASTEQEECERALHHLERVIQCEAPDTVAAVLLEAIPGTVGILVPPPGYLAGVRELCDRYGILLIVDEVMTGFGRTGAWMAHSHDGVVPDLITFAKGSNSGYVPAGGVIISDEIAATFDHRVFPGGLTYSGHPLAMAAIVATIGAMEQERIVENAAAIGSDVLGPGLAELAERHPVVGEVRGRGVFWALELVRDPETRQPLPGPAMRVLKRELLDRGVLPFVAENRLHVVPPCIITPEETAERLQALAAETGCTWVAADLTSGDDVARLTESVLAAGPVTALVNNAGGAVGLDPVESGSVDDWAAMFDKNVLGTLRVTQALLPAIEADGGGDLVFVTSTAAHGSYPGGAGYTAAKHAEREIATTLRLELAGRPVRVIEIAPGLVHTPEFSLNRFGGDAERAEAVYADVALGGPLVAEDVADAIAWTLTRPRHVNVDLMVLRPVAQSSNTAVARTDRG